MKWIVGYLAVRCIAWLGPWTWLQETIHVSGLRRTPCELPCVSQYLSGSRKQLPGKSSASRIRYFCASPTPRYKQTEQSPGRNTRGGSSPEVHLAQARACRK